LPGEQAGQDWHRVRRPRLVASTRDGS